MESISNEGAICGFFKRCFWHHLNKLGFSPKEIQVWLGHSDIKTTMNIYTHIDIGIKENMAAKIDGLFSDF